jgi:uncharacterized protein involved in high-affinity Fe2+ transport
MKLLVPTLSAALLATSAMAADVEIGKKTERDGMLIKAVYIQPVMMEPEHGTPAAKADIHLEADIHALKDNKNGFPESSWIPYLSVHYVITQAGGWKQEGDLMPMVADDGPHYGDNVKLNGPGKYHLTLSLKPPIENGFMRHTDKESGVGAWWKPFDLHYDFAWVGSTGKKGGY